MKINQQQLNNLPVYTQAGTYLGRVSGFELNTETHIIMAYLVSQSNVVKEILGYGKELVIAAAQVISINEEKMIVENNAAPELLMAKEKIKQPQAVPASFSRLTE